MSEPAPAAKADARKNEKKWGKVVMEAGYMIVPDALLKAQRALGLDPVDLNILLHLIVHWWDAERSPYLGKKKIAELMKVDESTVRRRIIAMEKAKLIQRIRRKDAAKGDLTNAIDFTPLVKKLQEHAEAMLAERVARKETRERRLKKQPPKLRAVE